MDRILSEEEYLNHTESDFLADPFFQEWVINPDEENETFWKQFVTHYPHKKAELENAQKLLRYLSFKEHSPSESMVHQSLQKHLAAIEKLEEKTSITLYPRQGYRKLLKIAAFVGGVVLLLAALLVLSDKPNKRIMAATDYGKLDSLFLPDSSKVVLNAHSKIRYSKAWNREEKREVWLDGEAFFEVRHFNKDSAIIQPHERFLVHTKDLDIEVLGTSFNVRQRRGKTEVVLQSGKIKVFFKTGLRKEITMKPGEMVTYDPEKEISQTTTNPEDYTAWKKKKLILHNPTVDEIVAYLEDNYGTRIILLTPGLGKRELSGPIPLSNLDDALFILTTVYSMEVVKREDNTIVLRSRN